MIETANNEIDVEALKTRIRQAVARREAEGSASFIKKSAELFELLSKDEPLLELMPLGDGERRPQPELKLQPDFVCASDDRYHVNDLLKYHDHQFVWNAYLALLKREPDEQGLTAFLGKLRRGKFNKIDILARIRYSPEGKRQNVVVEGLLLKAVLRQAYRVPILGYVLELAVALVRLPALIHHQRQLESYLVGQNQMTSDYVNEMYQGLASDNRRLQEEIDKARSEIKESLSRAVADLRQDQKQMARLQQQQLATVFRRRIAGSSQDESETLDDDGSRE